MAGGGNAAGMALGGIQILQGWGQILNAGKVASQKKKLADTQLKGAKLRAEYNEKEIVKAFTENYRKIAYNYGQKIGEAVGQGVQAQSELKTSIVSTLANTDMAESSFYNTAKLQADAELSSAVTNLLYNENETLMGLTREREGQIMANTNELGQAMYQNGMAKVKASMEEEQAKIEGFMSIVEGTAGAAGSMGGGSPSSEANQKASIQQTANTSSGWSKGLKKSNGSYLQLTSL